MLYDSMLIVGKHDGLLRALMQSGAPPKNNNPKAEEISQTSPGNPIQNQPETIENTIEEVPVNVDARAPPAPAGAGAFFLILLSPALNKQGAPWQTRRKR